MNRKQMISMWCGIAVFVLVSLNTETSHYETAVGSGSRTDPSNVAIVAWTDYGPLVARSLSVCIVTAGFIYSFRDKEPKNK